MRLRHLAAVGLSAALILPLGLTSPAYAGDGGSRKVDAATTEQVQRALKRLGFASITPDGRSSGTFKNFLCAWRDAVGKEPSRKQLLPNEAERILAMETMPRPDKRFVVGLNVNRECQSVAYVVKENGERRFEKIFRASTGAAGYETSAGTHVIQRRVDGLHNSTSYPAASGWNMYRPAYFTGWGEAFHGSPSDSSVSWAPSSHGCVRMLQKDIDYLWRKGANAIGTQVYVYGEWRG